MKNLVTNTATESQAPAPAAARRGGRKSAPPEVPQVALGVTPSLPLNLPPRGLTKAQAAAYVGFASTRAFDAQIARGVFPRSMPGTRVWDRNALDAAMDRLSGLSRPPADNADAEFDAFFANRNGRQR